MSENVKWVAKAFSLVLCVGALGAGVRAEEGKYLSPMALVASADGQTLYVAQATANRVAAVMAADAKEKAAYTVSGSPAALALSPDGGRLFVAIAEPQGRVEVIDLKAGKSAAQYPTGHTASAVAVSPDGATLYVCNRFNNDVSVLDAATGKERTRIAVLREPVAAALTADGAVLFVCNLLPAGASNAPVVAASVSVIDTQGGKVAATIVLPNGSTGVRGVCVSPDGKFAYVTHLLAHYQLPTTQIERGWMNTNAVSVIDVAARKLANTVLLDSVDRGAANPWPVACSADGKHLVIGCAGTHELLVIDRVALHERLDKAAANEKVTDQTRSARDVPTDLAFLAGIRRRAPLPGNGPRALVIAGSRAIAAEYYSDSLGVVDLAADPQAPATALALGPAVTETTIRKGEKAFNDARMCFQHWQSCVSCHPNDRVDGLNWDLLNDGIGNPKNTKSMLLSHATPPAMISGIRESAEMAVRKGMAFIQFAVPPEDSLAAIDEYLKSLKPVPSLRRVNGNLSESAQRGEKVFAEAGCAHCHPAPLFTDMKPHNVGTGMDREKDMEFDTPTLVEIWRTAPYLYVGQAVTMEEVLTKFNEGDKHGKTSNLSPGQIQDLIEYVLSQ